MTAVLETQDLTKSFFGVAAVRNVSITIEPGQILGLIGQNGAGKSTLMNMIGGVVQPDSGMMLLKNKRYFPQSPSDANRSQIAFIHQELNLFTNMTIAENIFIDNFPSLGFGPLRFVDWRVVKEKTRAVLQQVGLSVSPDTTVDRISPGERQLVEIARAIHMDASVIILDEPTTSLTARETDNLFALMRLLRTSGKALIYVSHILRDVLALSAQIAIMRDGELVTQAPAKEFDVKRMISLMVGRNIDNLFPERTTTPTTDPMLSLTAISAPGVVEDVTLTVYKQEVLGIFGLMGSGRTELARILFGLDSFERGTIDIDGTLIHKTSPRSSIRNHLAFVTENRRDEGLLMNINITDNIALVSLPQFGRTPIQAIDQNELETASLEKAQELQLKSGDIRVQPVKSLSGGNQQKVVIAKWLLSNPKVFIMDEPTRGIDVGAKYEIYSIIDRLAARGSAVVFISSELEELIGMCDRILVMSRGEIFGEFAREHFTEESILHAAFHQEGLSDEKPA